MQAMLQPQVPAMRKPAGWKGVSRRSGNASTQGGNISPARAPPPPPPNHPPTHTATHF
jgi:hypothetical protein